MAKYFLTVPDSITLPTDGNKIDLTSACELHRDDSAVPNPLDVDAAGDFYTFVMNDPELGTANAAATAPAAFTSGQWTAATGSGASEIDINITALPSDGGSSITALQYSVDSGSTWANLTGTGTGSRTIDQHSDGLTGTLTAATSYNIEVRAVNAVGNGADSDTKATTTGAASSSIDPAVSSLLGAKSKIRHDPTDWSTLWQDTSGTVAVTAAGQAVRRIDDTSGSGRHLTALSGNAIAQVGYLDWNDATFQYAPVPNLTSTSEFYALIDPDGDSLWVLMGVQGNSGMYEGAVQDGGSGNVGNGFGSGVNVIDNTPVSPVTRQQMYDTMVSGGGYKVQGIRGINMSNAAQVFLPLGYDTASPVEFSGRVKYLSISDALTTGERSSLQTIFDGEK